jgi:23S rRNA (guanosine2251-2'-O)-methyltransferase
LHPVEEAVRANPRSLDHVLIARERRDDRLERLAQECREAGVRVMLEARQQLTRMAKTDAHQGVLAMARERKLLALEDLIGRPGGPRREGGPQFLLALDGVEDPHNLGALLRTCDGAGADGVMLTERRAAPLSAVVAKSSAGAMEHVRIARVTNLVRALEQAKERHFWILGLDERGATDYMDFDFKIDCVLVLGREGAGMHDLVKKSCDHLLKIPMAGQVASLNVSVAGAVVMYEAMRQRRVQPVEPARPPKKKLKGLGS